jgi:hypothetical protein
MSQPPYPPSDGQYPAQQPYPGPGQPPAGQPYPGQGQYAGQGQHPGQQPYPGPQAHPGQQPYPGQQGQQPYPGQQSYPGQPAYPAQPYPQQEYPPQQYGPQQYGPQQQAWGPPVAAPKSGSKGLVIGLVAVLVLAIGGVGAWLGLRDGGDGPNVGPLGGVTTTKTALSSPETLNGSPKSKLGAQLETAKQSAESELRALAPGAKDFKIGMYEDGLIFSGANGTFEPDVVLKNYEDKLRNNVKGSVTMTGPSEVDAGPLGGKARCAALATSLGTKKMEVDVCFWVNGSVFGVLTSMNGKTKVKDNFLRLRGELEKPI